MDRRDLEIAELRASLNVCVKQLQEVPALRHELRVAREAFATVKRDFEALRPTVDGLLAENRTLRLAMVNQKAFEQVAAALISGSLELWADLAKEGEGHGG